MTGAGAYGGHRLMARGISARLEPTCGMICDLLVSDQGRSLAPMHKVPWMGETLPEDTLPHLVRMQGDFFCAPFADGGGAAPMLHGWPANGLWQVISHEGSHGLLARLDHKVQGARLTKRISLMDEHPFVYQAHLFEGGTGTISVANHAMVSLPGGGRLAFSAKAGFRTPASPPESDPERGRSALAYPARSDTARAFPAAGGGTLDLTTYPFVPGHEDFAVAIEAGGSALGWTAVQRLGLSELYLSLRNPRQLPMTMLWHSDGGRDYAPWNSRHKGCLGVEEGNAPHILGEPGGLMLGGRLDIRHAIGVIAWPDDARVASIEMHGDRLVVSGTDGKERAVPFDIGHLWPDGRPG